MPVLLINLDSALERRQASLARLESLGLECTVLRAVDGRVLPDWAKCAYSADANRRLFKRPLSPGEIGCYLSHYQAWKIAGAGTTPVAILEDDFEADARLPEVLQHLMAIGLPKAIIKLDAPSTRSGAILQIGAHHRLVDPRTVSPRTTAYVVTPSAAQALLDKALPFGRPVDMDLKHWWELGVRVLAISPAVVSSRKTASSQIEEGRSDIRDNTPAAIRFWRNLRYQARFRLRLLGARVCPGRKA